MLAAVAAVVALAGCTGVPTSSTPQTVDSIAIDNRNEPTQPGPEPGADARTIVSEFLDANTGDSDGHETARKYIDGRVRQQWSDATATIISGRTVSTEVRGVVTVTGRLVGSLSQNGVYTPQLQGTGDGGGLEKFSYRMTTVNGQNRIADLPGGLVLTTEQFKTYYRSHALYFFDQARRYLVPDPRWTSLEGARLTGWLVGQLANGPRSELSGSVTNDTLPTQANARRITAANGIPIKIEIPGSAQLDSRGKRLLQAQIAATVSDPTSDDTIQITDGRNPVPMPGGDTEFTAREATYAYTPVPPAANVFYLRDGDIRRGEGGTLPGKLKDSPDFLNAIAVSQPDGSSGYTVAATSGPTSDSRLQLGTQPDGYRDTAVRGYLSRPAWAPASPPGSSMPPEVWVGVGSRIVRVVVSGNRAGAPTVVSNNANAAGGRIVALRLSPEGSRVALVIESAQQRRLYIGSIVRSAGQVRIDALPSISPDGVTINDVGWIGSQKLIAIGSYVGGDARIFETNVDGSYWTARNTGGLPGAPDSVTVAVSQFAWVSVGGTVWQQSARTWRSPKGAGTDGTNPVYLE